MHPLRGIGFKLGSVLVFIVMSTLIKTTAQHVPAGQAVFFRSFFALPVILFWLLWTREFPGGLKTANPLGHVWRGFAGTCAMGLGFAGLAFLPLPEVTAIGYAAPLLTVIFAAMFLNEEVRLFRIAAVTLGLTGVLIVLSPHLGGIKGGAGQSQTLGAILVLGGAVFAALAQVFVRKLVAGERTATIVFYFSFTSSLLSLITLPFGWVIPTPTETVTLVVAGLLGGLGQILLTSSYRFADASLVAPFDYASMLFALLFGWLIFGDLPSLTVLAGAALVVTAGLLIIWRERRLGLERARQRKAMTPLG